MAKRVTRMSRSQIRARRNPANVRAGIDASKQPVTRSGQRTATKEEIQTYQETGVTTTQQREQAAAAQKVQTAQQTVTTKATRQETAQRTQALKAAALQAQYQQTQPEVRETETGYEWESGGLTVKATPISTQTLTTREIGFRERVGEKVGKVSERVAPTIETVSEVIPKGPSYYAFKAGRKIGKVIAGEAGGVIERAGEQSPSRKFAMVVTGGYFAKVAAIPSFVSSAGVVLGRAGTAYGVTKAAFTKVAGKEQGKYIDDWETMAAAQQAGMESRAEESSLLQRTVGEIPLIGLGFGADKYVKGVRQYYSEQGLSGEELNIATRAAARSRLGADFGRVTGFLAANIGSEIFGTKGVGKVFGKGIKITGTPTSTKFQTAQFVAPTLFKAGVLEGATIEILQTEGSFQKQSGKRVATMAALGGVSAGVVGATIAVTEPTNVLGASARTGYITDIFEKPADIYAGWIAPSSQRIPVITTVPTFGGVGVPQVITTLGTSTKQQTQQIQQTIDVPSRTRTKTPSVPITTPSTIPANYQTTVFPFPVDVPSTIKTRQDTRVDVPSTVSTDIFAQTTTSTDVFAQTIVTTPVTVSVPSNFAFVAPPLGGGGEGAGFRMPSFVGRTFPRIKPSYKPSFYGLSLGKTISAAPRFTTGLGVRLPVAKKKKKKKKKGRTVTRKKTTRRKKK